VILERELRFLWSVDMSGWNFGDEGDKGISVMLEKNWGFLKLQLNSDNIEDEGAKALAEILKKDSYLLVIELNNNMIDYFVLTIRAIHLNENYGGALRASDFAKGPTWKWYGWLG
jgi:hypothetical protein